jgi:hypothetical protein
MSVKPEIDTAYNAVTNNLEKAEGVLALILRGKSEDTEGNATSAARCTGFVIF